MSTRTRANQSRPQAWLASDRARRCALSKEDAPECKRTYKDTTCKVPTDTPCKVPTGALRVCARAANHDKHKYRSITSLHQMRPSERPNGTALCNATSTVLYVMPHLHVSISPVDSFSLMLVKSCGSTQTGNATSTLLLCNATSTRVDFTTG